MDPQIVQIIEMIVAVIAALIAYWQRSQKIAAENETRQVAAFFDPADESVTMPPASVSARSWKMNEKRGEGSLLMMLKSVAGGHYMPFYGLR